MIVIDHKITLTYLNIRQSIAILLTRLICIDLLFAGIVIGFYYLLVQGEQFSVYASTNTWVFFTSFAVIGISKIAMSIYVVLKWLYEYYEITPEHIVHKKGIIFRQAENYRLDHVRSMDIRDTFLGEIFNFGTITLYDIRLKKYLDMYLIHNPRRYAHVLQALRTNIEMKRDSVRLPLIKKDDESDE